MFHADRQTDGRTDTTKLLVTPAKFCENLSYVATGVSLFEPTKFYKHFFGP